MNFFAVRWLAVSGLAAAVFATLVLPACGYHPAYSGTRPERRLVVVAAPPKVARADAVEAALAGARSALSRAGVLASKGSGYPRMVVEVVRIDEGSAGIAATRDPVRGELPAARGSRVGVVARAWVEERRGAPRSRDTGDVRRVERHASEPDVYLETTRHDAAVRAAARKVGEALAARVLGEPEPDIELL